MVAGRRIGRRELLTLKAGETIWDGELPGFGARRQKGSAISFVLTYRNQEGRSRWFTIGRYGVLTPDAARKEAIRVLGSVASGVDPALLKRNKRTAQTVSDLCDLYLADAESGRLLTRYKRTKKPTTIVTDRGRIERHIKPLLGHLKVPAVTSLDVESFLNDVTVGKTAVKAKTGKPRGVALVRGGKGTASRTVGLLGAIFSYAVRHRMRADNPVRGVIRPSDGQRTRRLADVEYKSIAGALKLASDGDEWPAAVSIARLLLLTGWRRGEAINLKWSELDLDRRTAFLGDTKTGVSTRPLSDAACNLLRAQAALVSDRQGYVFPATRGGGPMVGFPKVWRRIASTGRLAADVTPHVFRHSFASLASDLGFSELSIGAMIGHKGRSITSRYVHAADAVQLAAADAVAKRTLELMGEAEAGKAVSKTARKPRRG